MVSVEKIKLGKGVSALCDILKNAIIVKIEYPAAQITHNCKGVTAELLTQTSFGFGRSCLLFKSINVLLALLKNLTVY